MNNLSKAISLSLITIATTAAFASETTKIVDEVSISVDAEKESYSQQTAMPEKSTDRVNKFKPIVLPFYDPSIEAGVMAIPLYAFYPSESDIVSEASTIALPLIYTTNGSLVSKLTGDIILNEDTLRVQFEGGYTGTNIEMVGTDTKKEELSMDADVLFKVYDDVFFGVGGIYKKSRYTADNSSEQYKLEQMGYTEDYVSDAGYRLSMQWDTREHYYYPHSGFVWDLQYENHAEWLGNDKDSTYSSLFTDFRHFHSINENSNNIIATKFVSRYLIDADNAPAAAYTMYGRQGKEVQRGFAAGQYIASSMANLEMEYRHKFSNTGNEHFDKSAVVLLGGVGKSFGEQLTGNSEQFRDSDWLGMAGVGYRYTVLPYERLNVKVDLTRNTDGETIVYFGLSESI